jgi:hypothetical protein
LKKEWRVFRHNYFMANLSLVRALKDAPHSSTLAL